MVDHHKEENEAYLRNLESELHNNNEEYTLEYPLCIPTMNNRKPSVLDNLDQFGQTNIHLFIYDWQKELYEWLSRTNITKHYVPKEYLTAQKMRLYMQEFMGEQIYWQLDDDAKGIKMYNEKKPVTLALAMRMAEKIAKEKFDNEEAGSFAIPTSEITCKWWNGDLMNVGMTGGIMLTNGKLLAKRNIRYTGNIDIPEDVEFFMDASIAGIDFYLFRWCYIEWLIKYGGKGSVASDAMKRRTFNMSLYKKYGSIVKFKRFKNLDDLWCCPRLGHLRDEITWEQEPLQYANDGDYESFFNYWKTDYEKKHPDRKAS